MTQTATLRSPLGPDEVAARLKAQTSSAWSLFNMRPMVGWVRGRSMRVRRTILLRNSFQPNLSADFEPDGAGTLIRCRFGLMPHILTFLAVFTLGAAGFAQIPVMAALNGVEPPPGAPTFWWVAAFLLLGVVLALIGTWLARDDKRILTEIVARTTEAEAVDRGGA